MKAFTFHITDAAWLKVSGSPVCRQKGPFQLLRARFKLGKLAFVYSHAWRRGNQVENAQRVIHIAIQESSKHKSIPDLLYSQTSFLLNSFPLSPRFLLIPLLPAPDHEQARYRLDRPRPDRRRRW